jgi:uncharacterized surface protein with fasciclin (FAS1) repeats
VHNDKRKHFVRCAELNRINTSAAVCRCKWAFGTKDKAACAGQSYDGFFNLLHHMKNHIISLLVLGLAFTSANGQTAIVEEEPVPGPFDELVDNGDGSFSSWLGTITPEGELSLPGFFEHAEHGRLFVVPVGTGVYLYDDNVRALGDSFPGWIFTSEAVYPYFYVFNDDASIWLSYLDGVAAAGPASRIFVNPLDGSSLLLSKDTPSDIVDVAIAAGSFGSLATALTTADLVTTLRGEGPFTVFAPTDDAFAKLDATLLTALLTDAEELGTLTDILLYHVVPGRLSADDFGFDVAGIFTGESATRYVNTVLGVPLRIDITPFGVMVNGSSMVTSPDVATGNGLIHVIDTVLLPPVDIVDTAVNAGLSSLVTAVGAAGLEETLRGPGPFTVFAPVNDAFTALGNTLDTLLEPANSADLAAILTYHVISGSVLSADVAPGSVQTVNGANVTFTSVDGKLFINGAEIIATDIITRNGVVHLIDEVILPPQ